MTAKQVAAIVVVLLLGVVFFVRLYRRQQNPPPEEPPKPKPPLRTGTMRCPRCGAKAKITGKQWECPWCGDCGWIK